MELNAVWQTSSNIPRLELQTGCCCSTEDTSANNNTWVLTVKGNKTI